MTEPVSEPLILRDHLAVYRTVMANERTLLAYARTSLAMLAAGVTLIEFTDRPEFTLIGVVCLPVGVVLMGLGLWRYRTMRRRIRL